MSSETPEIDYTQLALDIKDWGRQLGFQQVAITDTDLSETGHQLNDWLAEGHQGEMRWMSEHGEKRYHPEQLLPGTLRVITVRMDYLTDNSNMIATLKDESKAWTERIKSN